MKITEVFKKKDFSRDKIYKPYVIAEAGVNHGCSMDLAKRLIDEAKKGGADAIKFQAYKADTIAAKNSPAYWDLKKEPTKNQYELFKKYDKFWKKEFEQLKRHCDKVGIEFMSTPFDVESAGFLNNLMDVFKISSSDITNKPFIEYICRFGKPIILSTGASNIEEIESAVGWIAKFKNKLALLHCVLEYPTTDEHANLGMILDLKKRFPDKIIGYSDHTAPGDMKALEIAVMLGAQILEKHFTYDKTLLGNDHYHAMDMNDLKKFMGELGQIFKLVGRFDKRALSSEESARKNARRSLVADRDIPKGKKIEYRDMTFKRPASGVSPADIDKVLGRQVLEDIKSDEIIDWNMLGGKR